METQSEYRSKQRWVRKDNIRKTTNDEIEDTDIFPPGSFGKDEKIEQIRQITTDEKNSSHVAM